MMKAHGISTNGASIRTGSSSRTVKAEQKGCPSSKKRKMDAFKDEKGAGEDDPEQFDDIKAEQSNDEELRVKEEPGIQQGSTAMNDGNVPVSFQPHPDTAFLSGPCMYEPQSGYNMVVNTSNIYGLGEQQPRSHPSFFDFNGYEPSNATGDTESRLTAPHEPILINDSD